MLEGGLSDPISFSKTRNVLVSGCEEQVVA